MRHRQQVPEPRAQTRRRERDRTARRGRQRALVESRRKTQDTDRPRGITVARDPRYNVAAPVCVRNALPRRRPRPMPGPARIWHVYPNDNGEARNYASLLPSGFPNIGRESGFFEYALDGYVGFSFRLAPS